MTSSETILLSFGHGRLRDLDFVLVLMLVVVVIPVVITMVEDVMIHEATGVMTTVSNWMRYMTTTMHHTTTTNETTGTATGG